MAGSDISVLYREFADALTEVLAENAVGRLGGADLQGHAPPSRSILIIAMPAIFVRSRLLLRIGKRCNWRLWRFKLCHGTGQILDRAIW